LCSPLLFKVNTSPNKEAKKKQTKQKKRKEEEKSKERMSEEEPTLEDILNEADDDDEFLKEFASASGVPIQRYNSSPPTFYSLS
jgi:hypothetical protein